MKKTLQSLLFLTVSVLALSGICRAIENPGAELQAVGVKPELGKKIDLNLKFTNQNGEEKPLRDFVLAGKPIVLIPVYFNCPQLCGEVLTQVTDSLNRLGLFLGQDFSFLTVSFNPEEGPELGKKRADHFWNLYIDPIKARGSWNFLTSSPDSINPLMQSLGFSYRKDGKDFAHAAVLYVLTSQGVISQYFTGIEFPPRDIRLSIVEASEGKVGSLLDHAMLFCFRFDPLKGRYTWAVLGLLKVVGVLTILLLGGLIVRLRRKEAAAV